VTYTYNPAGQVATRTDASGTTTYTYDPLGRLASRVHTAGGGTLTYAYDLDGNLVSETDGAGTTQHRYDSRNLETATVTPDGKTIAFGYNDDGQRIDAWFNTDAGHTTWSAHTHTSYDSANRITEVSTARNSSDTTKATDLSYSYTAPSSSSCSTVQAAVAGQDTGLRWSQTDHVSGITTSYCYDSANRLTKATGSNGETWTYSYDTNGNRTQVTHNGATVQTLNYNSANQINDTGYAYDAAGNLTTGTLATSTDQITLTYNGSDQLTGVSGYQTGSYTHAGTDQTELITQTVPGGGTWTYSYGRTDKNNLPILDTFTNTNGTNYLTHDANGNPLAFTTYQGSTSYYALDGLGSPVGLINTRGVLISTYTYDPYGQATANNLTGNTATDLNPYRFAGGLLDRTTGYIHFGQRYYNPGAGRWTQQDSVEVIGDPSRGNRYEYAGDNPMNYIDPAGRSFLDDFFEVLGYVNNGFGYGLACIGGIVTAEEIAGVPATAVAGPVGTVAVGVIGCAAGVGISYAGGEYIEP
jgi:RHS repeat-associated protein